MSVYVCAVRLNLVDGSVKGKNKSGRGTFAAWKIRKKPLKVGEENLLWLKSEQAKRPGRRILTPGKKVLKIYCENPDAELTTSTFRTLMTHVSSSKKKSIPGWNVWVEWQEVFFIHSGQTIQSCQSSSVHDRNTTPQLTVLDRLTGVDEENLLVPELGCQTSKPHIYISFLALDFSIGLYLLRTNWMALLTGFWASHAACCTEGQMNVKAFIFSLEFLPHFLAGSEIAHTWRI